MSSDMVEMKMRGLYLFSEDEVELILWSLWGFHVWVGSSSQYSLEHEA